MLRRVIALICLLATLGIAGCGTTQPPGPRAIDGVFPAQGDVAGLPVRVTDLPGVIRTVSIGVADAPEAVSQVPGRDDAVALNWMGGMCDRAVEVVVDRIGAGLLVTISTKRDFGGCRMAGIPRSLVVELNEPVDASTVTLKMLD